MRPAAACALMFLTEIEKCMPGRSQAAKPRSTTLDAAGSSHRGRGWAPSGPASHHGRAELPTAARRAVRRRRSPAGALPRQRSGHAGVRVARKESVYVQR